MTFFTDQLQVEKARQYLLLESLISAYESSSDDSTKSSPVKSKKKRTEENGQSPQPHTSFWECYDELVAEKNSENDNMTNEKNMIATKLDTYLKIKCIPRQSSPYTWWAANKHQFPVSLSKLASKYLSAPASNIYSERLFSEAGNVYEENRSKLLPENGKNREKLIFLHHNLPLLKIMVKNV